MKKLNVMSFALIATIALISLNITGVIDINLYWVLAPILLSLAIAVIISFTIFLSMIALNILNLPEPSIKKRKDKK